MAPPLINPLGATWGDLEQTMWKGLCLSSITKVKFSIHINFKHLFQWLISRCWHLGRGRFLFATLNLSSHVRSSISNCFCKWPISTQPPTHTPPYPSPIKDSWKVMIRTVICLQFNVTVSHCFMPKCQNSIFLYAKRKENCKFLKNVGNFPNGSWNLF